MRVESMLHSMVFDEAVIAEQCREPDRYLLGNDQQKAELLDSMFSYSTCEEMLLRMNVLPSKTRAKVQSTSFMKEYKTGKIHIQVGFQLIHDERSPKDIIDEIQKKRVGEMQKKVIDEKDAYLKTIKKL